MSKAKTVKAKNGDTLCAIAIKHGFADCGPLRAEKANKDFLKRPLRSGDKVTVPEIKKKKEDKADKKKHKWKRPGIPPPAIRFVHGSKSKACKDDATLRYLNVSNFVSDQAGSDGVQTFVTVFGFDKDAHADPDTFKIEVVDPSANGGPVTIELEAVKPKAGKPNEFESIGAPHADMRKIKVKCEKIKPDNKVRFRSMYMRLVTDEWDFKELSGDPPRADGTAQGLLTTDTADGNDGDPDKLEILDQHVRATHTLVCCKAADKCKIDATVPIGPRRRRVRIAFHLFRTSAGSASLVQNVSAKDVRFRVRHWFRRLYASAELSPHFVAPEIETVDPPPANMITIAPYQGTKSKGKNTAGAPSKVTLRSRCDGVNTDWTVTLKAGLTPEQVGNLIRRNLPAGHKGSVHRNAICLGKVRGSADVIIERDDGKRNQILIASTDDVNLKNKISIAVPNVMTIAGPKGLTQHHEGEDGVRRLLRACKTARDRLDFIVVGGITGDIAWGYAQPQGKDLPSKYRPREPMGLSVVIVAKVGTDRTMDANEKVFRTIAHEAMHALADVFHTCAGPHQSAALMKSGSSASDLPVVGAKKRIHDTPLKVKHDTAIKNSPYTKETELYPAARLRSRGRSCTMRW